MSSATAEAWICLKAAGRRQPGFSRKKKRSGSGGGRPGAGARERCGISWIRRKLLEENGVRFVPGLRQGEDLYFCLMLLTVAPRLLILPDRLYHYRRERPGSASCGRDPRLGDFRMDLMGMESLARFWGERGLLDSPAAFGLVDYCMELMRRHFIMKEGAFFKASPEDREVLLSGWKKWLELVGAENVLPRLDRWDRAFCRLLLDCPLRSNFFSALHSRLMSSRKGRRGAYYTLKRHLMK